MKKKRQKRFFLRPETGDRGNQVILGFGALERGRERTNEREKERFVGARRVVLNPFSAAVPFWEQTTQFFKCFVPKTGVQF